MEKWYVAPTYQSATIMKVNEEDHKVFIEQECDRCNGRGFIVSRVENGKLIPIPVDGGICYKCNGKKKIQKWVKAYSAEEYVKYIAAQAKAKEKRIKDAEARKQAALDQSEENKKARLTEWGYDPENPLIWLIGGGNTYEIKDWLKEQGCKFCPELGWYSCKPLDIPVGYGMVSIQFEDAYTWFPQSKKFIIKENAKEIADAALRTLYPESHSEYIGSIKERVRDLRVKLTSTRRIDGQYGMSTIFTFDYNGNSLVWITTADKKINIGDYVLLTGTIKDYKEYKGKKVTYLNRCILKSIE